tara:strand:- start:317 stop:1240 length:924 start_codon:yes stop_codon:yes gene_type:complete
MGTMALSTIMQSHPGCSELQSTNMKSLKTPLRYPGGKSRALTKIFSHVPDLSGYDEYREPFVGGGSVAIHISKMYPKMDIWVNDLYPPLVNFWQQLQANGKRMRDKLTELKSRYPEPASAKGLFLESKQYLHTSEDPFWTAISFYIVNKCSYSGLTESSSFSKMASDNNFTQRGIDRLPAFSQIIKNWTITNTTYQDVMFDEQSERKAFIYLDPPYDIKDNLYGKKGDMHKGFNHDDFANDCVNCTFDSIVSYNSDQLIKDRFENWSMAEFDHTYTLRSVGQYMREQKDRKELLLFNYGTERLAQLN